MESWRLAAEWLLKISSSAMVAGGIFFVAFAFNMTRLSFHQRSPGDLEGFFSPFSLLADASRLTEAGVEIQQRAKRMGAYASILVFGGSAVFVLVLAMVARLSP